jgi:hypothetical protein
MKYVLVFVFLLSLGFVSIVAHFVLNNPTGNDQEIATRFHSALIKEYDFSGNVYCSPHPRKLFLKVEGELDSQSKAEIKKAAAEVCNRLSIDKKVIFEFDP